MMRLLTAGLALAVSSGAAGAQAAPDAAPGWRFDAAGSVRLRYESLGGQFRAGGSGGDQQIALRTLLQAEARRGGVAFVGEAIDSRAYLDDAGSPLSTSIVNAADVLQAHVSLDLPPLADTGVSAQARLGRMTIDMGSRRLVGRNGFRNARNAFTGVELRLDGLGGWDAHGFYTAPVVVRPRDRAALADNEAAFDEAAEDRRFWAVSLARPGGETAPDLEVYLYGLDDGDGGDPGAAGRRLLTPGARLHRPPQAGRFDYEAEVAGQLGERAGADVRAATAHLHVGYTFDAPWRPRLALEYELATGDDPANADFERFDPLFGLRRTDFGQTGIHGPLRRQNVEAFGVRAQFDQGRLDGRLLVKAARLESASDVWAGAGVVDPDGRSGDRLGVHVSTRLRWEAAPGRLLLETGGAWFARGRFAETAPNRGADEDPLYGYVMATVPLAL